MLDKRQPVSVKLVFGDLRNRVRCANGEPETARLILRDLVNATIGFEQLATVTATQSKSLHRMLSSTGNSSMDNLAAIFRAMRERLHVNLQAHSVAV